MTSVRYSKLNRSEKLKRFLNQLILVRILKLENTTIVFFDKVLNILVENCRICRQDNLAKLANVDSLNYRICQIGQFKTKLVLLVSRSK